MNLVLWLYFPRVYCSSVVQHVDQKPEGHMVDSCWGVFGLFFRASCVTDYTNIPSNTRVPRFNGIRDFSCLKLGNRDFKAKSGKTGDWKYACELECRSISRDYGIARNCWSGSRDWRILWYLVIVIFSSLGAKTIFTVKLAFSSMSSAQ